MNVSLGVAPDGATSAFSGQAIHGVVLVVRLGTATTLYLPLSEAAQVLGSLASTVERAFASGGTG